MMQNVLQVLALLLLLNDGSEGAIDFCFLTDPCTGNVPTLDVFGRSTNCSFFGRNGECDSSLTEAWYRTDTPMLSTCPEDFGVCGTYFPVYLNDSEPTVSDGMVNVTACMKGFTGCCEKTYDIVLKNCSSFVAYCLQHTTGCAERYCFGETGSCPTPTTTTTTTTTTATMPTKISPAPLNHDGRPSPLPVFAIVVGVTIGVGIVPGAILLFLKLRHRPPSNNLYPNRVNDYYNV